MESTFRKKLQNVMAYPEALGVFYKICRQSNKKV